ncbi:hypothetical protein, partial [Stenotrophomonas maltophilia]|uniref:hypothetical protein n=1 Tax=Stenotrophomonas maltophilia TaxID=40324 RepID=UPI0034E27B76
TYERDLPCVDRQQTLDARNQGPRPLALARLTLSPAGQSGPPLFAFLFLALKWHSHRYGGQREVRI